MHNFTAQLYLITPRCAHPQPTNTSLDVVAQRGKNNFKKRKKKNALVFGGKINNV